MSTATAAAAAAAAAVDGITSSEASPLAWQVVRVPIKIDFVGSSLTEGMLVGTFSCINI